jgi:KDEL-tailed cysteine endopeptidase
LIQQPVAVMVETGLLQFQFYKRGIFTGNCGNNVDNYMVLIGYGALD